MSTALGLLGVAIYIPAIIAIAAGVTWIVVKISPPKKKPPKTPATES